QPFLIRCTLRERLVMTMPDRSFSDGQLVEVLRKVGLEPILQRLGGLDVEHDWANALSLGEQHLVAVARLLLARPRFAFLKEVTHALGPDQVESLYQALVEASITYLSVGENHSLAKYHDRILELSDDGSWRYDTISDAASV